MRGTLPGVGGCTRPVPCSSRQPPGRSGAESWAATLTPREDDAIHLEECHRGVTNPGSGRNRKGFDEPSRLLGSADSDANARAKRTAHEGSELLRRRRWRGVVSGAGHAQILLRDRTPSSRARRIALDPMWRCTSATKATPARSGDSTIDLKSCRVFDEFFCTAQQFYNRRMHLLIALEV
jgi:hypothetical protein